MDPSIAWPGAALSAFGKIQKIIYEHHDMFRQLIGLGRYERQILINMIIFLFYASHNCAHRISFYRHGFNLYQQWPEMIGSMKIKIRWPLPLVG